MSADGDNIVQHEVVIIRRRGGGEDDGHHSAAWKIAYADFMTAMMAFFLVMWLVNAANKKQIVEVAAFFNPIKLTDKVPSTKGVHQTDAETKVEVQSDKANEHLEKPKGKVENSKERSEGGAPESTQKGSDLAAIKPSEKPSAAVDAANDDLFRDPFGMLTRIEAQNSPPNQARVQAKAKHVPTTDPFEPKSTVESPEPQSGPPADALEKTVADLAVIAPVPTIRAKSGAPVARPADMAEPATAAAAQEAKAAGASAGETDAVKAVAKGVADQIAQMLKEIDPKNQPVLDVSATPEGVLISLTDRSEFGMFAVGSAVPQPAVVRLMGDIGKVLSGRSGAVSIRGHTDARPYRSETYDNWRLSTSRAHAAYYMLVRGGLDERRITRVEGHADRLPKMSADPLAPANRRIEILLKVEKS